MNEILNKGPKLQQDLFDILLRFRMLRYVYTGDVEKMYRQLIINEKHQYYQLIWWRTIHAGKLECFKLNTVTYGTTAAPYLSVKCLQTLAQQNEHTHPLGSQVTKRDFYVDDPMSGSNNLEQAVQMQGQVIKMLNTAGLKLRKWCSNTPELLANVPTEDIEVKLDIVDGFECQIKTLGITWLPDPDTIAIRTIWEDKNRVTKRSVLSDVAHIFDPIELVSPVVIVAKIFIQDLWRLKLDWDE